MNSKNQKRNGNIFGIRLQALRKFDNLTCDKLAKELDVPSSSISRWENGINYPTYETLVKIAKYFDVSTDYLLGVVNFSKAFHSESETYMDGSDAVSISNLSEDEKMLIKAMIKVLRNKKQTIK